MKLNGTVRSRLRGALAGALAGVLVLVLAPPGAAQAPAAERLLGEAERLLRAGDMDAARRELELLVRQFPSDRLASQALLELARFHRGTGDKDALAAVVQNLLAGHATRPETAEALVLEAEVAVASAVGSADLEDARTRYRRVPLLFGRDTHPRLEARQRARIETGELSLLLGDPERAAAELLPAVEDEPAAPATGRARLGLGRAWLSTGDRAAAVDVLERLLRSDDATSDPASRARARDLLTLLHRRVLRQLTGEPPWVRTGRFPADGTLLREPGGVAAAADGRVVVIDPELGVVAVYGPQGQELGRASGEDLVRPGWTHDGRPFVVTEGGVTLPFHGISYPFTDPNKGSPMKNVLTAVPGSFGDWWVAARSSKSVVQVPAGRPPRELLAEERPEVVDVAHDAAGRIYALDAKGVRVLRFDRDGRGAEVVVEGEWKKAAALDVDELGYVYVLDRGEGQVSLYDPEGRRLARLGPVLGDGIELRNPVDLAVDGAGRLYVADTKLPFVVRLE